MSASYLKGGPSSAAHSRDGETTVNGGLGILDLVQPTLPFRELPVRCDQVAEEGELQVFRSAEELKN